MEEEIFMARVAEQAERFDDMVNFLNQVIQKKEPKEFNNEERNLFSVGFKNQIGTKRTAIRTINAIKDNPKYAKYGDALNKYKGQIEGELHKDCMSIIEIVKANCINSSDDESKAFFQKMIGDYYRYVAENASEDKLAPLKEGALEFYNHATETSEKLNACNPIRLGLALNFSVFYFEVMQNHAKACELGEKALQEALDKIDECDEETFRDAKSIIELLKENLSLWKEEEGNDQEVDDL
jgi:14-3-3 protein epsilon